MKIVIIGANGALGSDLCIAFRESNEVVELTHADVKVEDFAIMKETLSSIKPDLVLNTAAYHHVPLCEENPDQAFMINGIGALNLALLSEDLDYTFVHYSTDYVFDGKKKNPYTEEDIPNPLNIYALTKYNGENLAMNNCARHYVIRVSGIYGKVVTRAKGRNFVTTMIQAAKERDKVTVVNDEVLSPTSTEAIAANTVKLVKSEQYGLFHMADQDHCPWYEFAKEIFTTLKLKTPLVACSVNDFPVTVKRPFFSALENKGLKDLNMDIMPHWREDLIAHLRKYYM